MYQPCIDVDIPMKNLPLKNLPMKNLCQNSYITAALLTAFALSACSGEAEKTVQAPAKPVVATHVNQQAPVEVSAEDKGKRIFARCRACHTLPEGGKNRVGPNLWNIIGRTAGSTEGYAYSKTMKASEIVWSEEALSAYLENPAAYMPKNKMAFAGLRKQTDRDNLIAYLKANTQSQ